jgi:hypothetical protein
MTIGEHDDQDNDNEVDASPEVADPYEGLNASKVLFHADEQDAELLDRLRSADGNKKKHTGKNFDPNNEEAAHTSVRKTAIALKEALAEEQSKEAPNSDVIEQLEARLTDNRDMAQDLGPSPVRAELNATWKANVTPRYPVRSHIQSEFKKARRATVKFDDSTPETSEVSSADDPNSVRRGAIRRSSNARPALSGQEIKEFERRIRVEQSNFVPKSILKNKK